METEFGLTLSEGLFLLAALIVTIPIFLFGRYVLRELARASADEPSEKQIK